MPVSHGSLAAGTYQSSAFFISIEGSDRQLLFFGDVEPGGSGRPAASFRLTLPA
jgi:cAMP phosphodiesterase